MVTAYALPDWHVKALEWFETNAEREFADCPSDVGIGVRLTSQPGIWKPAGTPYALSVVQRHRGPYDDLDPLPGEDGTWTYWYHQQGSTEDVLRNAELSRFNRYLIANWRDHIPVGVIVPSDYGPGYKVLGLAEIDGFEDRHFRLVGPATIHAAGTLQAAEAGAAFSTALIGMPAGEFDPNQQYDERIRVIAAVHRRQGGVKFRRALLTAYRGKCAVTQYDAAQALEGAHIMPYRGPQTNHVANGLLLRADIHDLFDLGLVAVNTRSMSLAISGELADTRYAKLQGRQLWLPPEVDLRPSLEALDIHRRESAVA